MTDTLTLPDDALQLLSEYDLRELERYFKEQWGRTVKVEVEVVHV